MMGRLKYIHNEYVVLEISGIGYKINVPSLTAKKIGNLDDIVKLYTHLYIREDIISLYGFDTQEELKMFELLISVSGIGPKVAMSITSMVDPSQLGLAISSENVTALTSAQGVGLKTAQRIILELKDKVKNMQLSSDVKHLSAKPIDKFKEAIEALIVLGYSENEASKAIYETQTTSLLDDTRNLTVEEAIKGALKYLTKK